MFAHLQLPDRRERWLVGAADAGLALAAPLLRPAARRRPSAGPPAILLLRLERVGDLLMALDAIAAVRALAPSAAIRLVVGSWNEALARLIPGIDRVETLDAPWLARGGSADGPARLLARAWDWRRSAFDLAINFEGDIRSNVLLGLSGARRRVGFDMAGGGPLLTDRVRYDAAIHTRANGLHLVERAFDLSPAALAGPAAAVPRGRLQVPDGARARAADLLSPLSAGAAGARPIVALHASGGREIKQWGLDRFAEAANRLALSHGARFVLTGAAADRPLVDAVKQALDPGVEVVDLAGRADLVTLAAVLERVDLLLTGDTGPMHLAAALDVPTVAVFGPSDPARWGPASAAARVVRVQIPCSPCNRIRRPPVRCRGHVPDCLAAVGVDGVVDAAHAVLATGGRRRA